MGCWEWRGARNADGYGVFRVGGRLDYAHRVAYTALVGEIPPGLELDHLCSNRGCCRPEHLEPVEHAENMRRARARRVAA